MSYTSAAEASIRTLFDAINAGFQTDPGAGLNHVSNWLQELRQLNTGWSRALVSELDNLGNYIRANNVGAMGESLLRLGEQTAQAASGVHSFEGTGDKMRELSQKLIAAGGNLKHIAQTTAKH